MTKFVGTNVGTLRRMLNQTENVESGTMTTEGNMDEAIAETEIGGEIEVGKTPKKNRSEDGENAPATRADEKTDMAQMRLASVKAVLETMKHAGRTIDLPQIPAQTVR
jgi:hypothetical protein